MKENLSKCPFCGVEQTNARVEVRLSITGAPVEDISVSGEVNFADLWEDPARNIPAVAKHLGELLLVAFSLANPDMTENDTD